LTEGDFAFFNWHSALSHPACRQTGALNIWVSVKITLTKSWVKVMETFRTFESCVRILYSLLKLQNENWEDKLVRGLSCPKGRKLNVGNFKEKAWEGLKWKMN